MCRLIHSFIRHERRERILVGMVGIYGRSVFEYFVWSGKSTQIPQVPLLIVQRGYFSLIMVAHTVGCRFLGDSLSRRHILTCFFLRRRQTENIWKNRNWPTYHNCIILHRSALEYYSVLDIGMCLCTHGYS
jgi:hypothetical protein